MDSRCINRIAALANQLGQLPLGPLVSKGYAGIEAWPNSRQFLRKRGLERVEADNCFLKRLGRSTMPFDQSERRIRQRGGERRLGARAGCDGRRGREQR